MSPEAHTTDRDDGGVRERILSAALSILREEGVQELSQVKVARRAKVRQSHLTYYFPKRRDLLEAVAVRFIDGLARSVREASGKATEHGPGAMLRHLAAAITAPDHMRMLTGIVVMADASPECRVILVRETLRMQGVLAEALEGEDAFERAGLVVATLWGVGLYDFVVGTPQDPGRIAALLTELAGGSTVPASGSHDGRGAPPGTGRST